MRGNSENPETLVPAFLEQCQHFIRFEAFRGLGFLSSRASRVSVFMALIASAATRRSVWTGALVLRSLEARTIGDGFRV